MIKHVFLNFKDLDGGDPRKADSSNNRAESSWLKQHWSQVAGFQDWISGSILQPMAFSFVAQKYVKFEEDKICQIFEWEKCPTWTKFGCVLLVLDDVIEPDARIHLEKALTFIPSPISYPYSKLFLTLFTIVTTFYNLGSCCLRTLTCHLFLLWTSSRFHWIGHNKLFP